MTDKGTPIDGLCAALNLSQAELARQLGVTRQAFGVWKARGKPVGARHNEALREMARERGVDIEPFLRQGNCRCCGRPL